jgi:hypothetical protein
VKADTIVDCEQHGAKMGLLDSLFFIYSGVFKNKDAVLLQGSKKGSVPPEVALLLLLSLLLMLMHPVADQICAYKLLKLSNA